MSEHQFRHFLAIDRPLDHEQLKYMRRQSGRGTLTRREFTVEYHYDDFGGKPLGMMRRGFDLHVHFANFGIRQLMFRLPHGFPGGVTALQPWLIKHQIVWSQDKTGPGGVLQVNPEGDTERWNDYFCDIEDLLKELVPVRELLIQGDLRPLYLAWLGCAPPEAEEPPVPAGLKVLPQPLQLMADFYEVRECLIQVAADESAAISETVAPQLPILPWLEKKSEKQRIALLEQLLNDDSGDVRADVLQSIRKTVTPIQWPTTKTSRTMEELLQLAEVRNQVLEREKQAAEEEQRRKHLAALAENPDRIVKKITKLVSQRTLANYSEAVTLLCDLREALGPSAGPHFTSSVATQLRQTFRHTTGLIGQLKEHGFL